MEKLKQYKYIILVLAILSFAFYHYSYNPEQIRQTCYNSVISNPFSDIDNTKSEDRSFVNYMYQNCLRANGLSQ